MVTPHVTVEQNGSMVEVTVWPNDTAGVSVLVTASRWVELVAKADQLGPVRSYRAALAREAHSHGERNA